MGSIRTKTSFGLVVAGLVVLAVGGALAQADAPTRGDAQAVFYGTLTGGAAIRAHNLEAQGTPLEFLYSVDGVHIVPLIDALTYCDSGWHLVSLALFDDPANYASQHALFNDLSASDIQFALDGVALEVERTAVTAFTDPERFDSEKIFGINFGAFLAPGTLTLGTHELDTTVVTPIIPGGVSLTISFTVVSC